MWSQQTLQTGDLRYITGAPRVFQGRIIIGHGGADSANIRGYVSTYDAETGKFLWRFYLVPGNPADGPDDAASDSVREMMAKTWAGKWWEYGGGGNAWNAFSYDKETDTVFIGTGNGAPWNRKIRSGDKGDNLFVCSIVALDAKTGKYKWHYQINPGETWDYNAAMDMHLADLKIDGQDRKVLMTAPKNGFLYVIDRKTGKLISAEPIAKVTWANKIDLATGRPVENPKARYPDGKPFELWPNMSGAHGFQPSAYSPQSGLVYIPVMETGTLIGDQGVEIKNWKRTPGGAYDFGVTIGGSFPSSSHLLAWNPITQKIAWRVPTPSLFNGGIMATGGGLVFQGRSDGRFDAYSAADGKKLWSFKTNAGVLAAPISYTVNGEQYVSVFAGVGLSAGIVATSIGAPHNYRQQERRLLTFKIGGKGTLPKPVSQTFVAFDDPGYFASPELEQRGAAAFGRCFVCHGVGANAGGGIAPDLRTSNAVLSAEVFKSIVKDGGLVGQGMPRFNELSDQDLEAIRAYVRARAQELRKTKK